LPHVTATCFYSTQPLKSQAKHTCYLTSKAAWEEVAYSQA